MSSVSDTAREVIRITARSYGWDSWLKVREDVHPARKPGRPLARKRHKRAWAFNLYQGPYPPWMAAPASAPAAANRTRPARARRPSGRSGWGRPAPRRRKTRPSRRPCRAGGTLVEQRHDGAPPNAHVARRVTGRPARKPECPAPSGTGHAKDPIPGLTRIRPPRSWAASAHPLLDDEYFRSKEREPQRELVLFVDLDQAAVVGQVEGVLPALGLLVRPVLGHLEREPEGRG